MIKRMISVLLAVMMVVSVVAVGVVTSSAATTEGFTPESTKIYFDVDGTGWTMGARDKIAFYIAGGDFGTEANPIEPVAWGGKKLQGTATIGETGIFEFDPVAKVGYQLTEGVQYKIIFTHVASANWKEQTYDLFFTTDCLGHVAKCDGTMIENPVDSSKKAWPVYWDDAIDPTENGPVKAITSIGNVVGSCIESGKTDIDLLKEFFTEEKVDFQGKTGYQNAHGYVCEISETASGYKTEQKLIDDIGAGLGLSKDNVKAVMEEEEVVAKLEELGCSWRYEYSTLCSHTPGDPVIENATPATCGADGKHDEIVYCTTCQTKLEDKCKYNVVDPATGNHYPGDPVIENDHASTCSVQGHYDEVVYCTVCQGEISRETKYHELVAHKPGEPVIENYTPSTCTEDGSYDEVVYCTECGEEISRSTKTIPFADHSLQYILEVKPTYDTAGIKEHYQCTACGKRFADATGYIEVNDNDLYIPLVEMKVGDIDKDYEVTVMDATYIQAYLSYQRSLNGGEYEPVEKGSRDFTVADVDGDGRISIFDSLRIQRYCAKMCKLDGSPYDA